MIPTEVKLFAGSNSLYLAEEVAKYYGEDLAKMQFNECLDAVIRLHDPAI